MVAACTATSPSLFHHAQRASGMVSCANLKDVLTRCQHQSDRIARLRPTCTSGQSTLTCARGLQRHCQTANQKVEFALGHTTATHHASTATHREMETDLPARPAAGMCGGTCVITMIRRVTHVLLRMTMITTIATHRQTHTSANCVVSLNR